MELLYVWIEDYKNIHHQGFNFSPRYRFEFVPTLSDDNKSVIGGTLTEELEEQFKEDPDKKDKIAEARKTRLPDKFFGDRITNVTAIVGQNGAGKSNLIKEINYILNDLFKKKHKSKKDSKDEDTKEDRIAVEAISKYILVTDNRGYYSNIDKITLKKDKSDEESIVPQKEIEINQLSSIFFSNVFDGKKEGFELEDKIIDISTNALLQNKAKMDKITKYHQEEFIRQFMFAVDFSQDNQFPFDIPKKISLGMWNTIEYWYVKLIPENLDIDPETLKTITIFFTKNSEFKESKNFWIIISFRILYFFMYYPFDNIKGKSKKKYKGYFDSFFTELNTKTGKLNILRELKIFLKRKLNEAKTEEETNYLELLIQFSEKCIKIPLILLKEQPKQEKYYKTFYFKEINDNNKKIFLEFFQAYINAFKIPETQRIIEYAWEGMSSGQLAMLNIFSRFYSIPDEIKKSKSESLIVFIDEGELYLHAEWQKRFLNSLLKALPVIFESTQIQIILTSHTPFVLSDIPKENVIFLKQAKPPEGKDVEIVNGREYKKGQCIVIDGLKDKEQTFGANIHTLLSDTFFLDDGLIGEFAKGKILDVFKDLQDKSNSLTVERKDEIEKIISMIGEPIIKQKLNQLFEEKFQEDVIRMKKYYQNKIKELEGKEVGQ